jgi:hypothetical protein
MEKYNYVARFEEALDCTKTKHQIKFNGGDLLCLGCRRYIFSSDTQWEVLEALKPHANMKLIDGIWIPYRYKRQ